MSLVNTQTTICCDGADCSASIDVPFGDLDADGVPFLPDVPAGWAVLNVTTALRIVSPRAVEALKAQFHALCSVASDAVAAAYRHTIEQSLRDLPHDAFEVHWHLCPKCLTIPLSTHLALAEARAQAEDDAGLDAVAWDGFGVIDGGAGEDDA